MSTTELITPSPAPSADPPTFGDMVLDILPLVGVVVVAGPPVVFLVAPLLLLVLMLAGSFAVLATAALLLVAPIAFAVLSGAILVSPYLLVRRLRMHRVRQALTAVQAERFIPVQSPQVLG